MYQNKRISKHFVLLDFMQAHTVYTSGTPLPFEATTWSAEEAMTEAGAFCANLLEPLMADFGPCSVAYGWCPPDIENNRQTPHRWSRQFGAAADVAFPDFYMAGKSPIDLCAEMHRRGYDWERLITYAGSEFICMSWRTKFRRHALYENVRVPGYAKPLFGRWGDAPKDAEEWPAAFPARPDWRREEGEVIFHSQRSLRPQHIRVGRYFTFLDFCRCEPALEEGTNWVPPLNGVQASYARQFAQVLDPLVAEVGRVSITRGCHPKRYADQLPGGDLWRWAGGNARCTFLLPQGVDHLTALEVLESDPNVVTAKTFEHPSETMAVNLEIAPFQPAFQWSSARGGQPTE